MNGQQILIYPYIGKCLNDVKKAIKICKVITIKCILLSEKRQSERATYCATVILYHSREDKTIEMVNESLIARCLGILIGEAQGIFVLGQ